MNRLRIVYLAMPCAIILAWFVGWVGWTAEAFAREDISLAGTQGLLAAAVDWEVVGPFAAALAAKALIVSAAAIAVLIVRWRQRRRSGAAE